MAARINRRPGESHEVYPNSPLVEVVCEIRFPPNLAVDCRRHELYEAIRKPYGIIHAPCVEPGLPLVDKPFRFEQADAASGVIVAIDRLAYFERKYESHKRFIPEFLRLVSVYRDVFGLDDLERVGWRYINVIPFIRESEVLPLQRLLHLAVNLPEGVSANFENLSIILMSKQAEGSVTTKLQSMIRSQDNQEAFLLDFDYALTKNLHFTELASYVQRAHDFTRGLFEKMITDEYRQYLRGKDVL